MRIMKTNGMMKNILFAMMAVVMMLGSIVVLSACSKDSKDDEPEKKEVDGRIDKVIPPDIRKEMEKYITIYDGVNPPNVVGKYVISPVKIVFDSTNEYTNEHDFSDVFLKFMNQNTTNNTIDYKEEEDEATQTCNGAYISGEGNNFTIFFNTDGTYKDITFKNSLVISGTMTSDGISNIYYAFVVTEKNNDINNEIMDPGDFRVFKDGDGTARTTDKAFTRGFSLKMPTFIRECK